MNFYILETWDYGRTIAAYVTEKGNRFIYRRSKNAKKVADLIIDVLEGREPEWLTAECDTDDITEMLHYFNSLDPYKPDMSPLWESTRAYPAHEVLANDYYNGGFDDQNSNRQFYNVQGHLMKYRDAINAMHVMSAACS